MKKPSLEKMTRLAAAKDWCSSAISNMLRRRGFGILSINPTSSLFIPSAGADLEVEEFYSLMNKYSFRIFMRDLIKMKNNAFGPTELFGYCSEKSAIAYLQKMVRAGLVEEGPDGAFMLAGRNVRSIGDTLEWLVAKIFELKFASPSAWGIKLKGTRCGGDFDAVACVEGHFVYSEVKSAPPKHVEVGEVSSFLNRVADLRPDMALFIEDTELRMADKIVVFFKEELKRRCKAKKCRIPKVERLEGEIFSIDEAVFIINSKPDLAGNIGICLSRFLSKRGLDGWR